MKKLEDQHVLEIISQEKINKIFFEKLDLIREKKEELGKLLSKDLLGDFSSQEGLVKFTSLGGEPVSFSYNYYDKTRESSEVRSFKMDYKLSIGQELYETEASMFFVKTCQCCDKLDIKLIFPENKDVDHYIMVTELNKLIEELENEIESHS